MQKLPSESPICRIEIGKAGDGHAVSQSRKSCEAACAPTTGRELSSIEN